MKEVSLTIPYIEGPLRKAAEMLTALADGIVDEVVVPVVDEVPAAPVEVEEDEAPAPPPPAAEGAPTVEVDSEGLLWDARIHATSKTRLAKGDTWKLKRGVDPALVEEVKAELRAANASAVAEAFVAPEVPAEMAEPSVPSVMTETEAPEAPATPAAEAEAPVTFETICNKVTDRANSQLLKQGELSAILAPFGVASLPDLNNYPDLFEQVSAELDKAWKPTPA